MKETTRSALLLVLLVELTTMASSCRNAGEFLPTTKPSDPMSTLCNALRTYREQYGRYPEKLAELGPSPSEKCDQRAACLIDSILASGNRAGRRYEYRHIAAQPKSRSETFVLTSDPIDVAHTTNRHFFTEGCGTIRYEEGKPATATSPVVNDARR